MSTCFLFRNDKLQQHILQVSKVLTSCCQVLNSKREIISDLKKSLISPGWKHDDIKRGKHEKLFKLEVDEIEGRFYIPGTT